MAGTVADMSTADVHTYQMMRVSTRIGLLDLGIERFPAKGYVATTVQDLVVGSPYAPAAFELQFGCTETFYVELLRYRAAQRYGWWRVAEDPENDDLAGAIAAAIVRVDQLAPAVEPWAALLEAEFHQAVRHDEARMNSLRAIYAGRREELAAFFQPLIDRGWIKSSRTAAEVGEEVLAHVLGAQVHAAVLAVPVPDLVSGSVRLVGSDEQVRAQLSAGSRTARRATVEQMTPEPVVER